MKSVKEILKFSGSSFISFLLDYGLFAAFRAITQATLISNIVARIISACVNYTLNRKAVFKNNEPIRYSAPRYALLAVGILIGNTVVLKALTAIGIQALIAKLITEAVFFIISWIIQHTCVFSVRKKHGKKEMTNL